MATYELETEFPKIKEAFERVKKDVSKMKKENRLLIEEVEYLRLKVNDNLKKINKNTKQFNEKKKEIIGNLTSKKYHYPDCPFAKRIAEDNRTKFKSVEAAVKEGYDECPCIRDL